MNEVLLAFVGAKPFGNNGLSEKSAQMLGGVAFTLHAISPFRGRAF